MRAAGSPVFTPQPLRQAGTCPHHPLRQLQVAGSSIPTHCLADKRKTAEWFFMQPSPFLLLVACPPRILQEKQRQHGALWGKHEQQRQTGGFKTLHFPPGTPRGDTSCLGAAVSLKAGQETPTLPSEDLVRK